MAGMNYFLVNDYTTNQPRPLLEAIFESHEDVPDMGDQPGAEIMASLLPVVTHMQKLSY
jgi:hypothetical protein